LPTTPPSHPGACPARAQEGLDVALQGPEVTGIRCYLNPHGSSPERR
jgi:hypothetical protein